MSSPSTPLLFMKKKQWSRAMMTEEEEIDEAQLEFLPFPKGDFYSMAVSPDGRYLCVMMVRVGTNFENILLDI
ncbi:MAG: hypothetical protein ACP6IU_07295, partial [Candidatus Asgardarchaeia archaeon]